MTRIETNPHRRSQNIPGFGKSFWIRFSAHHRPANDLLDPSLVTKLEELDKLNVKWSEAVSECLNLDHPLNLEAAQNEDEDANADAARKGKPLPGPVKVREYRQRLEAATLARDSYARACEIAGYEISNILSDTTTPSTDTTKAADNVTKAIETLRANINTFLALEARDTWISLATTADPANKINTRGILPELQNAHLSSTGDDSTTIEAVLNNLAAALKLHTKEG